MPKKTSRSTVNLYFILSLANLRKLSLTEKIVILKDYSPYKPHDSNI